MFLGKEIQHVDQSHSVPADCPAPKVRRLSSSRIGPTLLSGFVPAVIEQARISIARMQVHQRKLFRDVVEICILMQSLRILRRSEERRVGQEGRMLCRAACEK